ncbi:MAG: hypothetical protein M9922_04730 [Microthrixaceae bacterium]|nr:hypothetical protein [Microthrixaceae bacterium]MCB1010310.1 hypothetical protein [Microthrixaceae bacterium]MCO5320684.1 hypothetical protein [Microthrixaceae bacterium]
MADQPDPTSPPSHDDSGSDSNPDSASLPSSSETKAGGSGLLRGRAVVAAAAIGIGVVAAVVIVSLTTDSGNDDPSDADVIAAEETTVPPDSTPSGDPDSSVEPHTVDLGAAASVGDFGVVLRTDPDGLVKVELDDPTTPAASGQQSQHCVLVTISGAENVETYGCVDAGADTTDSVLTLSDPSDASVGCAAVATREAPEAADTVAATSAFVITESTPLTPGDYEISVEATTGVGDGCAPADGPTEHLTTTTADFTIS